HGARGILYQADDRALVGLSECHSSRERSREHAQHQQNGCSEHASRPACGPSKYASSVFHHSSSSNSYNFSISSYLVPFLGSAQGKSQSGSGGNRLLYETAYI